MEHKYSEAKEKLEDALAQYTVNGHQQGRAQCLQSLGNVLWMEHKHSEARDKLEDALAQYTANGDEQGRVQCLLNLQKREPCLKYFHWGQLQQCFCL